MIALVRIALRRPYTFVVLALLILIVGPLAALRTPVDIFPDIRIPVIAVIWQYTGLPPDQMAGRMTTQFERALTTTVNDIEHIEANSYNTLSITKVFFQPNVDIRIANSQITAVAQTLLKQMPAGATPPLILNYNASTVPIIQLALSGQGLSEQALADIGLNTLRTPLVTVPGAAIPLPYGGKQRQVQIDLDSLAMQARGLSGQDVANALAAQNLITPVGTEKIGGFEYSIQLNNAPSAIDALGDLPIKTVNGAMVYIHDVGHVRDGNPPQTNIVHVDGNRSVLMQVLKNGSVSTLDIISRHQAAVGGDQGDPAERAQHRADRRSVGVRQRRGERRHLRGHHRGRPDQPDDSAVSRQLALHGHHRDLDSALGAGLDRDAFGARRDAQHHDAGRAGARGRHPGRRRHGDDREHQLASRAGQGGRGLHHGRRRPDRDAGLRLALVHLRRVRADVLPAGRGAVPVRADGRSGDVRHGVLVHPLAHAGADDGELPVAQARGAYRPARARRSAAALAQPAGALSARLRGALRARPARLSRAPDHGARPPRRVRGRLSRLRGRLVRAGAVPGPRLLSVRGRRADPHACPQPGRHPRRGKRQPLRRHPEGDPPDRPARGARNAGRQYRDAGQRHQHDLQQQRNHRDAGRRHPDQAQRGPPADRGLCPDAAREAARALSGNDVLVPAGRYHQPDPELRRAGADRPADSRPQYRRQSRLCARAAGPASACSGPGRRAHSTVVEQSRLQRRRRSHARPICRGDRARRDQQHGGEPGRQQPGRPDLLAQSRQRRVLSDRDADPAVSDRFIDRPERSAHNGGRCGLANAGRDRRRHAGGQERGGLPVQHPGHDPNLRHHARARSRRRRSRRAEDHRRIRRRICRRGRGSSCSGRCGP